MASTMTANPAPRPNSWRKLTVAVALAKKVTAISAAAVVTMRPLRVSPSMTAVRLSRPWSCSQGQQRGHDAAESKHQQGQDDGYGDPLGARQARGNLFRDVYDIATERVTTLLDSQYSQ